MTIELNEKVENICKTVQKRTDLKLKYQRNTTKQIELCEFE
jgi:hypothetical protein